MLRGRGILFSPLPKGESEAKIRDRGRILVSYLFSAAFWLSYSTSELIGARGERKISRFSATAAGTTTGTALVVTTAVTATRTGENTTGPSTGQKVPLRISTRRK